MKLHCSIWITLLTLLAASSSHAWQNPTGNISIQSSATNSGAGTQTRQQATAPVISQDLNQSSPGYAPPSTQPQTTNSPENWPNYPYPKYLNPYYENAPSRNFLTDAVDWFMAVPSNLMGNVCDFLDRRVFPKVPATHGGGQSEKQPESPSVTPLPQSVETRSQER
jgi:hypothetical protein